ncbi:MAG: hypothetical protein KDA92_09215 [Planctomycetales bacterium]|nr:hypothetical protein [Planctomycetales bacterium]
MSQSAHCQIRSAGAQDLTGSGTPDGWTNVLYINEGNPFNFAGTGSDHGVLTTFNLYVAQGRETQSLVTPFVAEPLVADPVSGDDFVIRAIGTTREASVDYTCAGEYAFAFSDTEQFTVQDGWVVGFVSSDPLGEREDALSPVPFEGNFGVDGWLTGTSTSGSGAPSIEMNEPILEGSSGTDLDAYGFREYQFQVRAAAGDTQPALGPLGKVGDACPVNPDPPGGNVAGARFVKGDGGPDSWTNVLYVNEEAPFDFSELGVDHGTLADVVFYVAPGKELAGMVTPFVAEPLVDNPLTGDDFLVHAVGTTREGGVDWTDSGIQTFPFSDTESFDVQSGWVVGFLSADPNSESDLASSPIPFVGNAGINGWLTGTSTAASGAPVIAVGETIIEGSSGTNVDAYGFRQYQFQITSTTGAGADPGDFNADGAIDATDIDLLSAEIIDGGASTRYDVDGNGMVDRDDRTFWVESIAKTYFGDSNLDGEFNTADLVFVFQGGKYEDAIEDNAGWADGDWDGDKDFTSSDFVVAFQGNGYELGKRAAVSAVPEPTTWQYLIAAMLPLLLGRRK